MSVGGGLYLLALLLVTGWGLRRAIGLVSPTPAMVAIPVLGAAGLGLWGLVLSLVGLPWSPVALLALPGLAAVVGCALPAPPSVPPPRLGAWDAVALACTVVSASFVATRPAEGWDFRYLWGLKAKVYALAGGLDLNWLTWFPNVSLHPDYPPLWSVLLAEGRVLGFDVSWTASVLTAGSLVALASVCWWAARRAHPALRALAVVVAVAAPSLAEPRHGGYAEPFLALLFAAGLAALAELLEAPARDRRGLLIVLATTLAALPLVKVEGTLLAAALWVGAALTIRLGTAAVLALPMVASSGGWVLFVRLHRIPVESRSTSFGHMIANAQEIVDWARTGNASWLWPMVTVCAAALLLLLLRSWRLGTVVAVWAATVVAAYLTTLQPAAWQVASSLDRVLSVPLPAVIAILLGSCGPTDPRRT